MAGARTNGTGPVALVLSGGGARAAYQAGVLSAIAECAPDLGIDIITGVSAGAINALYLAQHHGPLEQSARELVAHWRLLSPERVYSLRPFHVGRGWLRWAYNMLLRRRTGPVSLKGILNVQPLRGFLATGMDLDGVRRNVDGGRLRAVALTTTSYSTGDTVTFVEGGENLPLWQRHLRVAVRTRLTIDHLMASCAVPLVFPAVRIGGAFYGDGSVRQTAPLAPAIHLGAGRIIAVAMRAEYEERPAPPPEQAYPVAAEVFALLFHSVFLDSLEADAERLERINALLEALPAGTPPPYDMRRVRLLLLRPSRDLGKLARDVAVQFPRLVRLLVNAVGGEQLRASDFLSYLMFQPAYIRRLIEMGYEDTRKRRDEIERFLA